MIYFYKIVNGFTPRYLTSYLITNDNPVYNARESGKAISEDLEQEMKM